MKVIDLLNKIANGEEVPKEIKWGVHNFTWNVNEYVAFDEFGKPSFFKMINNITRYFLNDEVEIIEEDKKIEKFEFGEIEDGEHYEIKRKINEIIDKLNEMENE